MKKFIQSLIALSAIALAATFSSCDSWINDEEGDCSVHYKVAFSYTMNMAYADAFARQVKSVTLYVVDKSGKVVATKTGSGDALANPGYLMGVDVRPGKYDLLVWAQGESPVTDPTSFQIGTGNNITDLTATLPLVLSVGGPDPDARCSKDIVPLFHGLMTDVDFPDTYGDVTVATVDLTKDTNVFKVLLQSMDGTEIDPGDFSFAIEADNNILSSTNNIISTTPFLYTPWNVTPTSASFDRPQTPAPSRADEPVNGLMAELTTGRLMVDRKPILIVNRKTDNTDIIRIDLLQYLLLVKGEYNRLLTNQQYLDRTDSYTLMFFLDADHDLYLQAGIYINGWRVVPPQQGTL